MWPRCPGRRREGYGTESLSPLESFEYMAARLPVAATDLPAFRERLRHGENAWLVPPGDPAGFASALRVLLSDDVLRQRLADRAYLDVQQYTWAERVAAICRLAGC
jgi:glycosyltransferase involved in cell wall biosynthesis